MKVIKGFDLRLPVVSAREEATVRQRWLGSLAGWRWLRTVEAIVLKTLPASGKIVVPSVRLRSQVNERLAKTLDEDEFLVTVAIMQRQGQIDVMFVAQQNDWVISRAERKVRTRRRSAV